MLLVPTCFLLACNFFVILYIILSNDLDPFTPPAFLVTSLVFRYVLVFCELALERKLELS